METFMGGAMMIETALLSILLALWISWLWDARPVPLDARNQPERCAGALRREPA